MTVGAAEVEIHLTSGQAAVAAFTVGLLLTFIGVRINTRLIRANVKWWFRNIESGGGVHVHHMVIGVILMVVSGIALIAYQPRGMWLYGLSVLFGGGVALTLDEFALILHLEDVYWTTQGRLSVDAVIVAVCGGALLALGVQPLGNAKVAGAAGATAEAVLTLVILLDLATAVVCLLKGKLWTGFFALFIPLMGLVGALRVARPGSPWAHKAYRRAPKKTAKAQRREDRTNASWRAWRTMFFDLIAGKPHLPSQEAFGIEAPKESAREAVPDSEEAPPARDAQDTPAAQDEGGRPPHG